MSAIVFRVKPAQLDAIRQAAESAGQSQADFCRRAAMRACNGHDLAELTTILKDAPFENGKPSLLIAHTIKGKGGSFMENVAAWHHKVLSPKQLEQAMEELNLMLEEK